MAKRKPGPKIAQQTASTSQAARSNSSDESPKSYGDIDFFPFARYTSIVGVNSSLMVFVGLFLPRSTMFFDLTKQSLDESQATSRDRPQHPFLEPLTASPASTLACICMGTMVLQAWWSGWIRFWWIDMSVQGAQEEKQMQKLNLERKKLTQFGKAWLLALGVSAIFHAVVVLLGAPLTSHVLQTYLLALILAVLTVVPPAYTFGLPSLSSDSESLYIRLTWIRLFAEFQIRSPIERAMVYPVVGTIFGCWLGAIPIALDWDRPWQAWPLTPVYGALIGYIIASMTALTVSGIKALANEHLRALRASEQSQ